MIAALTLLYFEGLTSSFGLHISTEVESNGTIFVVKNETLLLPPGTLTLQHAPITRSAVNAENKNGKNEPHMTSMSSKLEPAIIWSCDTSQWKPCFNRCQLTITGMSGIKEVCYKTRLHAIVNLLAGVRP